MGYKRPDTRGNGDFITAAIWNRDVVANMRSMAPGVFMARGDSYWAAGADDGYILPAGANGNIIVYDSSADIGVVAASAGRMWLISETLLGSDATSIDIQNIPATYRHLVAFVSARSDYAATSDTLAVVINNNTSANYYRQNVGTLTASGGVTTAENDGRTSAYCGTIPGNTATAAYFGTTVILFSDYADSAKKPTALTRASRAYGTTADDTNAFIDFALLDVAGAITRLTFDVLTGTNLKQNSRVSLYGIL